MYIYIYIESMIRKYFFLTEIFDPFLQQKSQGVQPQALALDCLPQGKTTAEAFGLWGVAGGAWRSQAGLSGAWGEESLVNTKNHRKTIGKP